MKKAIFIIIGVLIAAYIVGLFSVKEIHTEINVDTTSDRVWNHLVGFDHYPKWNPFIKNISGELNEGSQINVTIQPPGGEPMDFKPKLLVVKKNEELRWIGQVLIPGLFDGEHYFKIEEIPEGGVRFIYGERFRGILALLFWSSVEPGTKQGFQEMNEALRSMSEGSQTHEEAQVAATLSAIAYKQPDGDEQQQLDSMSTALKDPNLPTRGQWQIIWGPVTVDEDLSYIAKGPALANSGYQYSFVIRGTIVSVFNYIQDLGGAVGLNKLPWPKANCSGARISDGAYDGYTNITSAVQQLPEPAAGWKKKAIEVLQAIEPGSEVIVTGHSLGAQLATVIAMWLDSVIGQKVTIKAYTFAAPTAGNKEFADCYAQRFDGSGRFYKYPRPGTQSLEL